MDPIYLKPLRLDPSENYQSDEAILVRTMPIRLNTFINLCTQKQKPQRYKTVKKTNSKYVDDTNQQEAQEFQLGHSMYQEDL